MTRKRSSRQKRQRPDRSEMLEAEKDAADFTATSPKLTGGDVDADWKRAVSVGEEAVGGSGATPDQDRVDDIGDAFWRAARPGRRSENVSRDPRGARSLSVGRGGVR